MPAQKKPTTASARFRLHELSTGSVGSAAGAPPPASPLIDASSSSPRRRRRARAPQAADTGLHSVEPERAAAGRRCARLPTMQNRWERHAASARTWRTCRRPSPARPRRARSGARQSDVVDLARLVNEVALGRSAPSRGSVEGRRAWAGTSGGGGRSRRHRPCRIERLADHQRRHLRPPRRSIAACTMTASTPDAVTRRWAAGAWSGGVRGRGRRRCQKSAPVRPRQLHEHFSTASKESRCAKRVRSASRP